MESRRLEEQRQYDALLSTYNDVNVALAALEPTSKKAEVRIERASSDVKVHAGSVDHMGSLTSLLLRDHVALDQALQKINSGEPSSVKLDEHSRRHLSSVLENSTRVLADRYQVSEYNYERKAIRLAAEGKAFEVKGESYFGGSSPTLQNAFNQAKARAKDGADEPASKTEERSLPRPHGGAGVKPAGGKGGEGK